MKKNRAIIFVVLVARMLSSSSGEDHSFLKLRNNRIALRLEQTADNALHYVIMRAYEEIQRVVLDAVFAKSSLQKTEKGFQLIGHGEAKVNFEVTTDEADYTEIQVSRESTRDLGVVEDCFILDMGMKNWFGGPEHRYQYPVEKQQFENFSYITKDDGVMSAISERYWLNSKGFFVFIEDEVPLFIDQNSPGHEDQICFLAQKELPYDVHGDGKFSLIYRLGISSNSKAVHMKAIENYLSNPTMMPDERMVRYPVWSTWARYRNDINEEIVTTFAQEILDHGFKNSQLEIDEDWEECWGSLTFNKERFPDIKNLTDSLHEKGFRVTLWAHPFVAQACTEWFDVTLKKKYLVFDHNGKPDCKWWNSKENTKDASHLDFTKPEVGEWFSVRLQKLQRESGIDGFKFDAGEVSWGPVDPVQFNIKNEYPLLISQSYVDIVSSITPLAEIRTGFRTQHLPTYVRMIDKETNWDWNGGLPTLITTLLQMNMVGYVFVLPDMVAGNGYSQKPDKELFIRWLQATVFMPVIQFSFVPWSFDDEAIELSKKFVNMHENYADLILQRFQLAVTTGEPVNPPIWWADPEDTMALQISDQFMLGDEIIAAPIINAQQTSRDIYLPKGQWKDGNDESKLYIGPRWLMNYNAPLDTLPYFVKSSQSELECSANNYIAPEVEE